MGSGRSDRPPRRSSAPTRTRRARARDEEAGREETSLDRRHEESSISPTYEAQTSVNVSADAQEDKMRRTIVTVAVLVVLAAGQAWMQSTPGWYQWRGPNRDGHSAETG